MKIRKIGSPALYPVYQWICNECFKTLSQKIEYTYISYKNHGKCQFCGKSS